MAAARHDPRRTGPARGRPRQPRPERDHRLARTDGASAAAIARRFGTTSDAIQALLLDHPAPADPAGGARRRRARYDISREQLRDLHYGQRLSFTDIGQLTGYSTTAIRELARAYAIPVST
jgi:hypothetical protein